MHLDLVATFKKETMDTELSANEIDRIHQIGKPSPRKKIPATIKCLIQQSEKRFLKHEEMRRLWNIYYEELNWASDRGA